MKQNHSVNIVFPGNFQELVDFLESKGVSTEFTMPGLVNSMGVLEITVPEEKEIEGSGSRRLDLLRELAGDE